MLRAHLVFVTRYQVFAARHPDRIVQIIRDVRADFGTGLAEFNGGARARAPAGERPAHGGDPPGQKPCRSVFPSAAAGIPGARQYYWRARRLWSGSYFAGPAGAAPISVLRQYIEQQDPPA